MRLMLCITCDEFRVPSAGHTWKGDNTTIIVFSTRCHCPLPLTGRSLPRDLFERTSSARIAFRGLALQQQIVHSMFDVVLHGANSNAVIGDGALDVAALHASSSSAYSAAAAAARRAPVLLSGALGSRSRQTMLPSACPPTLDDSVPYARWSGGTGALFKAVQNRLSFVRHVPGTAWQAGFGHLATYGSGYYTYL